jgi:hypothetical protein
VAPAAAKAEDLTTVRGIITLKGKPVTAGRIIIYLDNDQFVGAKIKDGRYTVDRVPLGQHRVSIEGNGVAPRYAAENRTPILLEVQKGAPDNVFNIEVD